MSGYELYFYQGLHAFEIFHGQPIDEGLLRRALGGRMKFSIATVSIGGSLTEKLAAIAAAGFEGVEIFEADVLAHEGSPRRDRGAGARPRARDRRLPAVPRLRGHARAAARARLRAGEAQVRADERARRRPDPDLLQRLARLARRHRPGGGDLRELGEIAEGFGIDIGFEALAWGRHVSDYRDAWEIVRRADHPRVG